MDFFELSNPDPVSFFFFFFGIKLLNYIDAVESLL